MTPDQRLWIDENVPDHHLKYDEARRGWRVEVCGKCFYFGKSNYLDADAAKTAALAFRNSLPSAAFHWRMYAKAQPGAMQVST